MLPIVTGRGVGCRRAWSSVPHGSARAHGPAAQQPTLPEAFQDPHCTPNFPLRMRPPQAPAAAGPPAAQQAPAHPPAQLTSRRALAALTQRSDSAMAMGFYAPPAAHAGGKQLAAPAVDKQPAASAVQPAAAAEAPSLAQAAVQGEPSALSVDAWGLTGSVLSACMPELAGVCPSTAADHHGGRSPTCSQHSCHV